MDIVVRAVLKRLGSYVSGLQRLRVAAPPGEERRRFETLEYETRDLSRAGYAIDEFLGSQTRSLMSGKSLLLLGAWGTGKTHFLCDVVRKRLKADQPSLLFLAQNLPPAVHPIDGLCAMTGLAPNRQALFAALQRMGERRGSRALLVLDGINEGDRAQWRRVAGQLAGEVAAQSHVGLVLSCRTPFERLIFGQRALRGFAQLKHPGFEDIEFDAQLEFFEYYGIPVPSFPLLAPEFSRPLFLKLLCEALQDLSAGRQRQGLRDIASGQKGMTYVLEHFVKQIGKSIEQDYSLASSVWDLLKGQDSTGASSGFAEVMSDLGADFLSREGAVQLIRNCTRLPRRRAEGLLRRLISDGILAEGLSWDSESRTEREVIRFPYQRFGDHLIARHLLAKHLRKRSDTVLRRCFNRNRPLGRLFEIERRTGSFVQPGIATAVMLEFPERVKRVQGIGSLELLDYLPHRARRYWPIMEIFLSGLHWRSADSFSEHTDRLLNYFRQSSHQEIQDRVLETLMVLAARPGHRYCAGNLLAHLAAMDMPARDLYWGEFLRRTPQEANRLIAWVAKNPTAAMSIEACRNTIRLLALLLTTTDRDLRDRATRALFLLGLRRPTVLFEETKTVLQFNDPYLPERMLAADYGVAMNLWADPSGDELRDVLPEFAEFLLVQMFTQGAPCATTHSLRRGYALGIIELARRVAPSLIPRRKLSLLKPPFAQIASPFRAAAAVVDADVNATRPALHMDFENYTLGGLVAGRRNYDFDHTTYQEVRREILGRMADLGYSYSRFEDADRSIMSQRDIFQGQKPGQTDRYGKKYSWIAFFEMYGLRDSRALLRDAGYQASRSPDCDIDPSFPVDVTEWAPQLPDLFVDDYGDPRNWLEEGPSPRYDELYERAQVDGLIGPWVLLDGHIFQSAPRDAREVFSFLRGLVVRKRVAKQLESRFGIVEYPGNYQIPDPLDDFYTYAGEIPWSARFRRHSAERSRHAPRDVRKAFEGDSFGGRGEGVDVEVPVRTFRWESYHSSLNQVSNVDFPAPHLCDNLELVNHKGTLDLFDGAGKPATIFRRFKALDKPSVSQLLYLRRDLLDRYLGGAGRSLVWITWGERNLQYNELQRVREKISEARSRYSHIHRQFRVYSPQSQA